MIAGMPGVGISGIFYLLCAFSMPFVEIGHTIRGRSSLKRWHLVLTQFAIFCGIIAGSWLTGLVVGHMLTVIEHQLATHSGGANGNVFRVQSLSLSFVTLIMVVVLVTAHNLWIAFTARRSRRKEPSA